MSKFLKAWIACTLVTASSLTFAVCSKWTSEKIGSLDKKTIDEASGLVASVLQPGKLIWSNDSGNSADLFATGTDGKVTRTVRLSGMSNDDFEALSLGPCPSNKADSCIYVGDIGDGLGWRSNFKIGIFKEADFWSKTSITPEKVISYSASMNAESMIVNHEGKIFIFSKHESGLSKIVMIDSQTGKAMNAGQIDLTPIVADARGKGPRITDASLSPDGDKVLLLTYGEILEVNMEALTRTLATTQWRKGIDYNIIKSPELPQQETIAYLNSGNAFILSSESPDGDIPPVLLYTCQ